MDLYVGSPCADEMNGYAYASSVCDVVLFRDCSVPMSHELQETVLNKTTGFIRFSEISESESSLHSLFLPSFNPSYISP